MRQAPDIHEIQPGLWLGPCPRSPEFIRALREDYGIDSLVSVQTDADLRAMGLSWATLWRVLMARDIAASRVPIVDFDDSSLRAGLTDAVQAVQSMRAAGRTVYVHCSIGINRSPTVVIAWLVRHGGLSLDEAWQLVRERRPQVMPNHLALTAWLASQGLPAR